MQVCITHRLDFNAFARSFCLLLLADKWHEQSNEKSHGLKVPNRTGARDQMETYRWDRPVLSDGEGLTDGWLDSQLRVPNREDGNRCDDGYDFRANTERQCW